MIFKFLDRSKCREIVSVRRKESAFAKMNYDGWLDLAMDIT